VFHRVSLTTSPPPLPQVSVYADFTAAGRQHPSAAFRVADALDGRPRPVVTAWRPGARGQGTTPDTGMNEPPLSGLCGGGAGVRPRRCLPRGAEMGGCFFLRCFFCWPVSGGALHGIVAYPPFDPISRPSLFSNLCRESGIQRGRGKGDVMCPSRRWKTGPPAHGPP